MRSRRTEGRGCLGPWQIVPLDPGAVVSFLPRRAIRVTPALLSVRSSIGTGARPVDGDPSQTSS